MPTEREREREREREEKTSFGFDSIRSSGSFNHSLTNRRQNCIEGSQKIVWSFFFFNFLSIVYATDFSSSPVFVSYGEHLTYILEEINHKIWGKNFPTMSCFICSVPNEEAVFVVEMKTLRCRVNKKNIFSYIYKTWHRKENGFDFFCCNFELFIFMFDEKYFSQPFSFNHGTNK